MEILIVAGMIAAFFAGAYIRQPFGGHGKKDAAVVEKPAQDNERDRQAEQLNNLMNYNGRKQYPEEDA